MPGKINFRNLKDKEYAMVFYERKWESLVNLALKKDYNNFRACFAGERDGDIFVNIQQLAINTDARMTKYMENNSTFDKNKNLELFLAFKDYTNVLFAVRDEQGHVSEEAIAIAAKEIYYHLKKIGIEREERKMEANYRMINFDCMALETPETPTKQMLDMLSKGDSLLMGSSKEYKDIQKSLKLIDEILKRDGGNNFMMDRFATLCFKTVLEKAEKYISDREEVEKTHALDSYKGRRIHLMRQVCCALRVEIEERKNDTVDFIEGEENAKMYYNDLKTVFDQTTYSPIIYSELRNCTNIHGKIAIVDDVYEGRTVKVLNTLESRRKAFEKMPLLNKYNKVFTGKKVSYEKLGEYEDKIKKFSSYVEDSKPEQMLKPLWKSAAVFKGIEYDKNKYPDSLETVTITGDKKLDFLVCREQIKKVEKKLEMQGKINNEYIIELL